MKRALLTIVAASWLFAAGACNCDPGPGPGPGDGGTDGGTDFAAFVIDLIENQTAENNEPVAVPTEEEVPDNNSEDAFNSLF